MAAVELALVLVGGAVVVTGVATVGAPISWRVFALVLGVVVAVASVAST